MPGKLHRPVLALFIRCAIAARRRFRRNAALRAGKLLGSLAARLFRRERLRAQRELRRVFRGRGGKWSRDASKRVYEHIGRNLLELFAVAGHPALVEAIVRCEGFERIEETLERGRGAIILSAHLGSWELLGAFLARRLGGLHVVGKRIYYPPYNEAVIGLRRSLGVETLFQDEPPRKVLRLLRKGRPVGVLADLYSRWVDGAVVDFLGRPAYTATAPASLALASGAPILPVFIRREGGGHFAWTEEPIHPVGGGKRETVIELTRAWSAAVERAIEKSPEQWAWFHRRWRTKP